MDFDDLSAVPAGAHAAGIDIAFKDEAARNLMDLLAASEGGDRGADPAS